MGLNEINKAIADQINAKELRFAKFRLVYDNEENYIIIAKGVKALKIKLDLGSDTYILTKIKSGKEIDIMENVYFDDLQNIISEFFKFEYVMNNILNSGIYVNNERVV